MHEAKMAGAITACPSQPLERTMVLSDGKELGYRAWLPSAPTAKSLVIFHSLSQPPGRIDELAALLDRGDVAVFGWDGHARTSGGSNDLPLLTIRVHDIDRFARHLARNFGMRTQDMVVLAFGAQAVTVSAWVHDFAPLLRGLVLIAPTFGVKSRDAARHSGRDPLWSSRKERTVFRYTATRLIADAAAIRTPTLVLTGGGERGEESSAQRRFFDRLGASVKRRHVLPDTEQDLGHAEHRRLLADEVRRFMSEAFQGEAARQTLLDADRHGYTRQEYDRLTSPLPRFSPKGLYYAVLRTLNRSLALVSPGMRLGWQTGFDSGEMLDYAYQNQAHGDPLLGRWIDRVVLNNLGWKACRRRKQHTEIQLREAIASVRAAGQPVRLLDVAAGPGRYVLETVRALGGSDISALLRDNIAANLEAGRKLAGQMGLQNVSFELGDAFDEQSLAQIRPPPNVAIACGFYELFSDNQQVLRSLRGLAAAMQAGGYLIHTGQPWNPHLELIARTLVNRTGAPAVMRRRTQEELDDLVRAAGFEKTDMKVDEFGVFTVSLARRV